MMAKLCLILIVTIAAECTAEGLKQWKVGDEHLKRIFGQEAFDNGKIPNHKIVYAYPREDNSRNRRQVNNELLYTIESLNETLNLTLSLNSKLLSESSLIQMYKRDGSLQTINSFPKNCHYFGQVDGDPNSKVAVSLCGDKMVGVVETSDDSYLMEPVSGSAHIAYEVKRSPLPEVKNIGGANDEGDEMLDVYINGLDQGRGLQRKRRQGGETYSMEIMVFVDSGVVASHGSDIIVNYIMAIMNIMASLYHDPTLRNPIDLVISRLIIEEGGKTSALNLPKDASAALDTFCQFQFSLNSEDESSALHHDHAILITSVDICGQDTSGDCNPGVVGFAPVGGMCSSSRSCTINEDRGLGTAFVLAHETGHNLGMRHDGFMNDCVESQRIMATSTSGQEKLFLWSNCSADYLAAFLNSGNEECLLDPPIGRKLNASALEGLNFDVDAQCRAVYGPKARFCPADFAEEEVCSRLWCQLDIGEGCYTRNTPPADGTSCGEDLVCLRGSCEDIDDILTPTDGGWSSFGPYSECSRTCEFGVRFRERQCNNPVPAFGGKFCGGVSREYEVCNTDPCPDGSRDFRDIQCAATDDISFNGEFHSWESFSGQFPPEVAPCQLLCQTDGGSINAVRASSVIDGTKCISDASPSGVCIQGGCIPLGCDNVLNSDAREDVCGVCNGNDSTATTIIDSATGSSEGGYVNVGIVPRGARDITIMETSPSGVIALQLGNTNILNGDFEFFSSGSFIVAAEDFNFVYNRSSSSGKDVAFINGPLSEQLFVRVFVINAGSYTLDWEYIICDNPSPSTTSVPKSTSTVMTFTTVLPTTVPHFSTTSVTSSTITPVSTTIISQLTSSTSMIESTSTVVISTTSTSQELSSTLSPRTSSITTTRPTESSTTVVTSQVISSTFIPQSTSIIRSTSSSISTTTSTEVSSTRSVHTTATSISTTSVSEMTPVLTTTISSSSAAPSSTTAPSTATIMSTTATTSTTRRASTTVTAPATTSTRASVTPTLDPTPIDCNTYDLCSVCNGGAKMVTGSSSQSGVFGYYDAVTIPAGARHIMVYEDPSTTDNFIALAVKGVSILNGLFRIKASTVFTDDNGVVFTYVGSPEESVSTPGPLSQPLTIQGLIGVGRRTHSLSWSYVTCDVVAPTSTSSALTPTSSSSSSTVTPTPEVLFPLWDSTRYGKCFLNDEGVCLRSREVFCIDGLTGVRLNSDDLCAARRKRPSTTLRCSASLCQQQTNK